MAKVCARGLFLIVVAALGLYSGAASANGDLFFEAQETPGNPEYVVFGNVKDDKGNYLDGATVRVTVSKPDLSYTAQVGILGRYRTLDVGKAIQSLGYDIDPSLIKVTMIYPGYHVVRSISRARHGQRKGAIEIDFVMAPDAKR
jgi:hypothetical protein